MDYDVVAVEVLDGYQLRVRFADGLAGIADLTPRLSLGRIGDVFDEICDPDSFRCVKIVDGVLTWPGDIDLAPDAMHARIKAAGISRLEPYKKAA